MTFYAVPWLVYDHPNSEVCITYFAWPVFYKVAVLNKSQFLYSVVDSWLDTGKVLSINTFSNKWLDVTYTFRQKFQHWLTDILICLCQFHFSMTPMYATSFALQQWNSTHLVLSWFIANIFHRHVILRNSVLPYQSLLHYLRGLLKWLLQTRE